MNLLLVSMRNTRIFSILLITHESNQWANVLNPLLDSETQQWNKSLLDLYMELEQWDHVLGFGGTEASRWWTRGSETEGWNLCIDELQTGTEGQKLRKRKEKPSVLQKCDPDSRSGSASLPTHTNKIREQSCRTKSSVSMHYSTLAHKTCTCYTGVSQDTSEANNVADFFLLFSENPHTLTHTLVKSKMKIKLSYTLFFFFF